MHYKMYEEMMEQPRSLKDTMEMEKSHMKEISEKFQEFDKYTWQDVEAPFQHVFHLKMP